MDYKQSLADAITGGFYRIETVDGGTKITNGKSFRKLRDYALQNQHFEYGKHGRVLHLLEDAADCEPWPFVELTIDFDLPYGKVPYKPLLNIAPKAPIIAKKHGDKDTSILWKHLENLCGDVDQDTKEWVKDIFQNPMNKPGTALTIRSDEGTGKGTFFDKLMHKLLGERHMGTSRNLFGERFNGLAKHKLLININEGGWDNNKSGMGMVKSFITDPNFHFEDKGKDAVTLPNPARLVFTTNESWVVKNDGSRRFCMLTHKKDDFGGD